MHVSPSLPLSLPPCLLLASLRCITRCRLADVFLCLCSSSFHLWRCPKDLLPVTLSAHAVRLLHPGDKLFLFVFRFFFSSFKGYFRFQQHYADKFLYFIDFYNYHIKNRNEAKKKYEIEWILWSISGIPTEWDPEILFYLLYNFNNICIIHIHSSSSILLHQSIRIRNEINIVACIISKRERWIERDRVTTQAT